MTDWGVVGLCAAGGLVVAPLLNRAGRTVTRPVKAAPAAATAGDPAAQPHGWRPTASAATAPGALAPGAPGVSGPGAPAPAESGVAAPTWTSVGWGNPVENVVVAVATAVLLGLAALRLGAVPSLGAYGPLLAAVVCLSAIDLRTGLLPRRFVYPAWALVAVGLVAASNVDNTWHQLLRALIGGAVAFVAFFATWFVYPRGMGFGDVRLAGLLGMALGWLGWRQAYIGFLAACVLGCVLGVGFMAVRGARGRFPFGPALAAGAAFGVLWGGWLGDLWFRPG